MFDAKRTVPLLFHHRWTLPILESMAAGRLRIPVLRHAHGMTRDVLEDTLAAMVAGGLARPNAGHGHPLRPDYLLTPLGTVAAVPAAAYLRTCRRLGIDDLATRKWPGPVLAALRAGAGRFGEIEDALAIVTPRALSLTLVELEDSGLLARGVEPSRPPRSTYRCAGRAGGAVGTAALELLSRVSGALR